MSFFCLRIDARKRLRDIQPGLLEKKNSPCKFANNNNIDNNDNEIEGKKR